MSAIWIHAPELMARRGFNGFYRHFLLASLEQAGAHGNEMNFCEAVKCIIFDRLKVGDD